MANNFINLNDRSEVPLKSGLVGTDQILVVSSNTLFVTTKNNLFANVNNLRIDSNGLVITNSYTPANSNPTGVTKGKFFYDTNFIYIKVSNTQIRRVPLRTFDQIDSTLPSASNNQGKYLSLNANSVVVWSDITNIPSADHSTVMLNSTTKYLGGELIEITSANSTLPSFVTPGEIFWRYGDGTDGKISYKYNTGTGDKEIFFVDKTSPKAAQFKEKVYNLVGPMIGSITLDCREFTTLQGIAGTGAVITPIFVGQQEGYDAHWTLKVTNGGQATFAWGDVVFENGITPTLSVNGTDVIDFWCDDGSNVFGALRFKEEPSPLDSDKYVISALIKPMATGFWGDYQIPASGTLERVSIFCDTVGSVTLQFYKATESGYPPTVSITPSNVVLANTNSRIISNFSGWNTTFTENDILRIQVVSSSTITSATVNFKIIK
jgi:hypothetical protein